MGLGLAPLIFLPLQGLGAPEPQYTNGAHGYYPRIQENQEDQSFGPPLFKECPRIGGRLTVDCRYTCAYGQCYVKSSSKCHVRKQYSSFTKHQSTFAPAGGSQDTPPKCRDRSGCPHCRPRYEREIPLAPGTQPGLQVGGDYGLLIQGPALESHQEASGDYGGLPIQDYALESHKEGWKWYPIPLASGDYGGLPIQDYALESHKEASGDIGGLPIQGPAHEYNQEQDYALENHQEQGASGDYGGFPIQGPAHEYHQEQDYALENHQEQGGGQPLYIDCQRQGGQVDVTCDYSCTFGQCYVNASTRCTTRQNGLTQTKWAWNQAEVKQDPELPPKCRDKSGCPACGGGGEGGGGGGDYGLPPGGTGGQPLYKYCQTVAGGHHEVTCDYSCSGWSGRCMVNATTHCTINQSGFQFEKWNWVHTEVKQNPELPPKCRDRTGCPVCPVFNRQASSSSSSDGLSSTSSSSTGSSGSSSTSSSSTSSSK